MIGSPVSAGGEASTYVRGPPQRQGARRARSLGSLVSVLILTFVGSACRIDQRGLEHFLGKGRARQAV